MSHFDPPLASEPKILKFRTHSNPPLNYRPDAEAAENLTCTLLSAGTGVRLEALCDILTLKVVEKGGNILE